MNTIEVKKGIQVGFDDLVQSLSQLNGADLSLFFNQLNDVLTKNKTSNQRLSQEAILLKQIKELVPTSMLRHLKTLQTKQRNNLISDKESEELLMITDFMEQKSIEKVELLHTLAKIKQVPLSLLANQLGNQRFYE